MIITKQMIERPDVQDKDLWATPWSLFKKIEKEIASRPFTIDPCCAKETAKCDKFLTPEYDALLNPWDIWDSEVIAFCNPPYSRGNIDKWINRFHYMASIGHEVIALLPVSTSSDWFKSCIGNEMYFIDKRVRFENAPFTAPFSSVIINFNKINKIHSFKQ